MSKHGPERISNTGRGAMAAALGLALILVVAGLWTQASNGSIVPLHHKGARAKALALVQDERGRPLKGHNPAKIKQRTLRQAASAKKGPGVKAASNIGTHHHKAAVKPSQVLPAAGGKALAGCEVAYGTSGQCLPDTPPSAVMAGMDMSDTPWTCAEVRKYFPNGLKAISDPEHLDTNGDKIACGRGD